MYTRRWAAILRQRRPRGCVPPTPSIVVENMQRHAANMFHDGSPPQENVSSLMALACEYEAPKAVASLESWLIANSSPTAHPFNRSDSLLLHWVRCLVACALHTHPVVTPWLLLVVNCWAAAVLHGRALSPNRSRQLRSVLLCVSDCLFIKIHTHMKIMIIYSYVNTYITNTYLSLYIFKYVFVYKFMYMLFIYLSICLFIYVWWRRCTLQCTGN